MKLHKMKIHNRIGVFLLLFVFALCLFVDSNYLYGIFIIIGLYAIIVQGLGLMMGYAGQVSFGHAAFFGIGAYSVGILTTKYHWPTFMALGAALLLPSVIAALIGRQTLKLRELYLALATLGFGILVNILFMEGGELTGGPSSLSGIPHLSLGSFASDSDARFFTLVWLILCILLVGMNNLVSSRVGRALCAIRDSEIAAANAGIDCAKVKAQAFIFSAMLAGFAGGLYAFYVSFISPSPFTYHASIQFVLIAVIGGLGTLWGPLLGATLIVALNEFLREVIPLFLPGAGGEYQIIIYGIILVVLMIYQPNGMSGALKLFDVFLQRKPSKKPAAVFKP